MNFFLIGYRGTGKTTLGKIVAEKLGRQFVDLDDLIMEMQGKKIPEIFAKEGEAAFRNYETQALKQACGQDNQIIACGGGIIIKEENIRLLKENGTVCLLKASEEKIFERIHGDKNRPALTNKNAFDEIKHVLEQRKANYELAKDFEIDTSIESVQESAERIVGKVKGLGK
ncbi:MAG: shikimate kinase [Candidatus Diapherotrites archaeon]|uniref:shikimate kinase n=1 Tax=Candidatus Iainarchaeum sp. TaxID=3101447 RepID=A0A8T4KTL1_9ARCH|nr:shikimate kinase [Candidatus Diapherotrites archaeon]